MIPPIRAPHPDHAVSGGISMARSVRTPLLAVALATAFAMLAAVADAKTLR
jgi:hypothetical protein